MLSVVCIPIGDDGNERMMNNPLIDVKSMLSRTVTVLVSENPDVWEKDSSWYVEIEQCYRLYIEYIKSHSMFAEGSEVLSLDVKDFMAYPKDLSEYGCKFVAYSKSSWLNYYDRNKNKPTFNAQKKLDALYKKWQETLDK